MYKIYKIFFFIIFFGKQEIRSSEEIQKIFNNLEEKIYEVINIKKDIEKFSQLGFIILPNKYNTIQPSSKESQIMIQEKHDIIIKELNIYEILVKKNFLTNKKYKIFYQNQEPQVSLYSAAQCLYLPLTIEEDKFTIISLYIIPLYNYNQSFQYIYGSFDNKNIGYFLPNDYIVVDDLKKLDQLKQIKLIKAHKYFINTGEYFYKKNDIVIQGTITEAHLDIIKEQSEQIFITWVNDMNKINQYFLTNIDNDLLIGKITSFEKQLQEKINNLPLNDQTILEPLQHLQTRYQELQILLQDKQEQYQQCPYINNCFLNINLNINFDHLKIKPTITSTFPISKIIKDQYYMPIDEFIPNNTNNHIQDNNNLPITNNRIISHDQENLINTQEIFIRKMEEKKNRLKNKQDFKIHNPESNSREHRTRSKSLDLSSQINNPNDISNNNPDKNNSDDVYKELVIEEISDITDIKIQNLNLSDDEQIISLVNTINESQRKIPLEEQFLSTSLISQEKKVQSGLIQQDIIVIEPILLNHINNDLFLKKTLSSKSQNIIFERSKSISQTSSNDQTENNTKKIIQSNSSLTKKDTSFISQIPSNNQTENNIEEIQSNLKEPDTNVISQTPSNNQINNQKSSNPVYIISSIVLPFFCSVLIFVGHIVNTSDTLPAHQEDGDIIINENDMENKTDTDIMIID